MITIEELLNNEPVLPERRVIARQYLTTGVLEKACRYAELVCDVFDGSYECYGFLLKKKQAKDRVARDVLLAQGQCVDAASVHISGEQVIAAGRYADRHGWKIIGWWHSHAQGFDTFHSDTDDDNFRTVLNGIAPTNYVTRYHSLLLTADTTRFKQKGNVLLFYDAEMPKRRLEVNLSQPSGLAFKNARLILPVRTGYAYSLVVNALRNKPYSEIGTKEFCNLCGEGEETFFIAPRVLIDETLPIEKDAMIREIRRKVRRGNDDRTYEQI
ncbi:MAG: Mov34/MPN/PAD-1 family protein [archaeon]